LLDPFVDLGLQTIKPKLLIHTAWVTTPKVFWDSDSNVQWIEASKRLINEFEKSGGERIVVTGSCAEYSWNSDAALSESSPESPASRYGKSKLELLNWIRDRDLNFLWTRTFFQFGMKENGGRLIPALIDSLHKGETFQVRSGSDNRDFVFVEDVIDVLAILISKQSRGVVNIGSGCGILAGDIARKIAEMLKLEELLIVENNELQRSEVVSNPEKLNSIIGNYRWTPVELALIRTIEARQASNP
jgi:nucleoside-diphosphate-sugar epimerase